MDDNWKMGQDINNALSAGLGLGSFRTLDEKHLSKENKQMSDWEKKEKKHRKPKRRRRLLDGLLRVIQNEAL